MTKQEEIMRTPEQKEAHKVYRASLRREKIIAGLESLIRKWEKDSPDAGYGYDSETWIPELLACLDSLGVVIKGTQLLFEGESVGFEVEPLLEV